MALMSLSRGSLTAPAMPRCSLYAQSWVGTEPWGRNAGPWLACTQNVWVSALHKVNFALLCLSACGAVSGLQNQHPLCLQSGRHCPGVLHATLETCGHGAWKDEAL